MNRISAVLPNAKPLNDHISIDSIPHNSPESNSAVRSSIWNPLVDFWLLGGLSIFFFFIVLAASNFRGDGGVFQLRFTQLGALFSILTLVCNHPHFLISYRFGYGRGLNFVFRNWFSLIFVPSFLIAAYAASFYYYSMDLSESIFLIKLNGIFEGLGLRFRIGDIRPLGPEIVGLTIWLMYLTVGWHYAKQVYGCMMVQAFYSGYDLSSKEKSIFKWCNISVAIYQFVYMASSMEKYSSEGGDQDSRFQGFHLSLLGLPNWLTWASIFFLLFTTGVGLSILIKIYLHTRKVPPLNFLVPWVAFYVWWIPIDRLPEYYLLMVPFFHSLQYLPFALRVEREKLNRGKWLNLNISLRIIGLLLVGVLFFEMIPSLLDKSLKTELHQTGWFFMTCFAVFVNIHHFFIDSVVWKFKDDEVTQNLLHS